jgi:hypothetical protein
LTSKLDRDLIKHASEKLAAAARRRVREGAEPASAARAAIRETQALFPHGWRIGVQGDDGDDVVEVWEVEHKAAEPIAVISREPESVKKRGSKKRSHAAVKGSKKRTRCGWTPDADAYEVAREFAFNWTGGALKQACVPAISIRSAPIEDVLVFNNLVKALGNPATARKVPPLVVERVGVGTDYRIVDGRHRLAAANEHGFAHVPVIIVEPS